MCRVDSDCVDELGADALDGFGEAVSQRAGHDARRDGDSGQVGHFLGADGEFLAAVGTGASAQDKVEGVFCVNSQTGDLGAEFIAWDVSCLAAVAVETEGAQLSGSEVDRVPF